MSKAKSVLRLSLLVLLLLWGLSAQPQGTENAIMRIVLNTQDMGDQFLVITQSGDILITVEGLRNLGLRELQKPTYREIDDNIYVPLSSLAPEVTFRLDDASSTIHLTADPNLLKTSIVDLGYKSPPDTIRDTFDSAFLNYGIYYDLSDDAEVSSIRVPSEVGLSIDGRLLAASFSYDKHDGDAELVRLMSSFVADNTDVQRRLTVGDFTAFSGELGSGGLFGGVSIRKQFSITPRFVRSPDLNLYGVLESPSELEIYVDNRLVETRRLPPGRFEFLDLPNNRGAGEVTLIVRDAFGTETISEYPFYLSTALLKEGLHEYSYNLGFRRQEFGRESFKYGDMAFLGFHRFGFTDSFTAGLRGEASGEMRNLGAGIGLAFTGFGELGVSVAASWEGRSSGYAGVLGYSYRGRNFSSQFAVRGFSRDYSTLNISPDTEKPRYVGNMALHYNPFLSGSLSVQFSATDSRSRPDMKMYSLSYTRRLFKTIFLFLRASRTEMLEASYEFAAGITVPLGFGQSAGVNYINRKRGNSATAYLSKNPPPNRGSGYRLQIERVDDPFGKADINGNAMLSYRGSRGVYSATYRRSRGLNYYSLGFSGGVGLINRSYYFSRPIRDSFALVKVGDIEGVGVRRSGQEIGVTDRNGEIFVPDLISYYDNRVSFDEKTVPVNYEIQKTAQYVSTPLRGGTIANFAVKKLQAFVGKLFIVSEGKWTAAEYWGLEVKFPDAETQVIVGRNGEVYLENLPAGDWPARLFRMGKECLFELAIPQSDSMIVELGEVTCELN